MLETIFRNVMDIRLFDLFTIEFVGRNDVDFDEIIEVMEIPAYMRFEVEESLEHLVKQNLLQMQYTKIEGNTGCKMCSKLDQYHIPRFGEHKKHVPYTTSYMEIQVYGMSINKITANLYMTVFEHIQQSIDDEEKL